ncbi:MAG: hypothetical protein LBS04_02370 [Tannerellaceae bacterium]|jgi:hypothetical protein|nr:hypothetical protein [Tannerellaceae bacterium]
MKKVLLLPALLSVFLICCSEGNDDVFEEEPDFPDAIVDLLFNEPLIMYGCSVEEILEAETLKNFEHVVHYETYYLETYHSLVYKDNKNGLEYVVQYGFQNNILYSLSVIFEENVSAELFDALCSSLAEKYEEDGGVYLSEEFTIWCYYSTRIRFLYTPNGFIPMI